MLGSVLSSGTMKSKGVDGMIDDERMSIIEACFQAVIANEDRGIRRWKEENERQREAHQLIDEEEDNE